MRLCGVLLVMAISAFAFAQPTERGDPIQVARPDFTNTPQIVPVGLLQFEGGGTYYARGGPMGLRERSKYGETLLRYGMQRWAELRIELPTYTWAHRAGDPDGWDNTRISSVVYLGHAGGFDFGIQPALTVPSGSHGVEDESVSPEFYVDVTRRFPDKSSLRGTYGAAFKADDDRRHERYTATLSYLRPFSKTFDAFVEYAGYYDRTALPVQYAHVGLRLRVSRTQQFDVHGGLGLNRGTEHGFVGAGYAVRL